MKLTTIRIHALACAFLAATAIGAGTKAYSQTPGTVWDSSQLPESRGRVKQYTLTPRGDVDGLILADGTEVKLPPHLSAQIVYTIRPGDEVSIRGLRARAIALVDAASITNISTGRSVADNGPPRGPDRSGMQQALSGRIVTTLHGKRGEAARCSTTAPSFVCRRRKRSALPTGCSPDRWFPSAESCSIPRSGEWLTCRQLALLPVR